MRTSPSGAGPAWIEQRHWRVLFGAPKPLQGCAELGGPLAQHADELIPETGEQQYADGHHHQATDPEQGLLVAFEEVDRAGHLAEREPGR